jgi:hypothetical protein
MPRSVLLLMLLRRFHSTSRCLVLSSVFSKTFERTCEYDMPNVISAPVSMTCLMFRLQVPKFVPRLSSNCREVDFWICPPIMSPITQFLIAKLQSPSPRRSSGFHGINDNECNSNYEPRCYHAGWCCIGTPLRNFKLSLRRTPLRRFLLPHFSPAYRIPWLC